MAEIEPSVKQVRITNGVHVGELSPYNDRLPRVVFLARLHPRKRAPAFVETARLLAPRFPQLEFVLAGPDEGDGKRVAEMISALGESVPVRWIGAVDPAETDSLLRSASAYVLPAEGEVFPMSLLEALRAGTPSVVTTSLGIADACRKYGAAVITDGSPEAMAHALAEILTVPGHAESLRQGGATYLRDELNIDHVALRLEGLYDETRQLADAPRPGKG
ncbi:glycosyltransferase involved in cell wall biosynthesis [Microbacterium laevaniformans]|nr:glycosyltransferase involved in cell wall biosynthesis [Microbacterium laevaniformans]